MPAIRWDTQADFESWTLENIVVTPDGYLELAEGATEGTATSPVTYLADWQRYSMLRARATRPTGTNVYLYFRSGATAAECEAAEWQGPVDTFDDAGMLYFDLRTYFLRNPDVPVGPYIQFKVVLEAE